MDITCWEWEIIMREIEITIRDYRLVFIPSVAASRLRLGLEPRFRSLASQGCSKWRSTSFVMKGETASTCSGSSSDYQNKCLNQIIRMLMLRYPVVLDAGNLIQEPQASSSHFRRLTNMRVLMGVSNCQLTTNFSAKCQLTTNFSANCQLTTKYCS